MVSAVAESHPRLRARREAVQRSDERRKWIRTTLLLLVLVAAISVLGLARSRLLDVEQIRVEGSSRLDADEVEALAAIEPGVALIDIDLAGVEQRVERHPWVADASARREWPDTLTIDVVERMPVAASPVAEGAYLLVDLDAMALDVVDRPPAALPIVRGLDVDAAPGQVAPGLTAAVQVVDAIPDDLAAWVVAVDQGPDGAVVLELIDGVPAELGTADRLADKLVALATLLSRVQADCIESFNVQAPDAPVATRCRTA